MAPNRIHNVYLRVIASEAKQSLFEQSQSDREIQIASLRSQ
jgi:hypothetical protein